MTPAPRVRDAWITPKEEPETVHYHREVPAWELTLPVVEEVSDVDYMGNYVYWEVVRGSSN